MFRNSITRSLAVLVLLMAPQQVFAHKLNLFATRTGDTVEGSVYYPTGAAAGLAVKLLNAAQQPIADTISDDAGNFRFSGTPNPPLLLVSETSDGHRAEFRIDPETAESTAQPPATPQAGPELETLVRTAVRQELQPLRAQLAEQADKTRMREIVSGIGYIVGIFGLVALLRARKRRA